MYDNTLRSIADQLAPERTVKCRLRPLCPRFDAECGAIRRNCRRLERRYRRTHDPVDKDAYVAASRNKHDTYDQKKKSYWLAVWLSGNAWPRSKRSCATSDPVGTRMGDRLWTGNPSWYVTSQLGRLSLLPSVGR